MKSLTVFALTWILVASLQSQNLRDSYPRMIDQIVESLQPTKNENAIVRYDPGVMSDLAKQLSKELQNRISSVELWPYGPVDGFEDKLNETDIYIWMPVRRSVTQPADQIAALVKWLDSGRGRQIHFHWGDGTRNWDSTEGQHNAVYDSVYLAALDIDYDQLDIIQEKVSRILTSGEVTVTSPSGTNLRFNINGRVVTKQNGNASAKRMENAKVRIEREIELPAGVIRVSPIEESVYGTLAIGSGTISGIEVEDLKLTFAEGRVENVEATKGKNEFVNKLEELGALNYFRELGIGFNPNLQFPKGYDFVPYYGYGAGVVRLSLGNNIEVGGKVSGDGVQWMFFLDTTVSVGDELIVKDGKIVVE